jgi:hypothetical protein
MHPHHNYRPPREPSRLTVIVSALAAALTVAALTVAFTLELAR